MKKYTIIFAHTEQELLIASGKIAIELGVGGDWKVINCGRTSKFEKDFFTAQQMSPDKWILIIKHAERDVIKKLAKASVEKKCTCEENSKQRALCPVCDKKAYDEMRLAMKEFRDDLKR